MIPAMLRHSAPASLFALAELEPESLLLPLLWFAVIILTVVVESQTTELVSIWFAPGAFVAMILAFCDVRLGFQLAVFVGVTILCLILAFTVIRPRMKAKNKIEKTNADSLEGKLALVEEGIDNAAAVGVVKINGQLWTARTENPADKPAKGAWVEIIRVEGSKLICKSKN